MYVQDSQWFSFFRSQPPSPVNYLLIHLESLGHYFQHPGTCWYSSFVFFTDSNNNNDNNNNNNNNVFKEWGTSYEWNLSSQLLHHCVFANESEEQGGCGFTYSEKRDVAAICRVEWVIAVTSQHAGVGSPTRSYSTKAGVLPLYLFIICTYVTCQMSFLAR